MVPPFRTPLLPTALIAPLLLRLVIVEVTLFRKAQFPDDELFPTDEIVPLLVRVVSVVSSRLTAVLFPPPISSIVTPELIVTLELPPVIFKSVQLV